MAKRETKDNRRQMKVKYTSGFCDGCGMPTQSKTLRPDDQGGYSIFCKGCIDEGKAIAQMSIKERERLGFD